MLLAVEGGGFFSSSASGYSKGLALLLLGQKNEEKPMKVSPWNQYQLVDQETESDLQLASCKNRLVCGCASLVCFGGAADELDNPSPLKVGSTQHQQVSQSICPPSGKGKDQINPDSLVKDGNTSVEGALKSSLKKAANSIAVSGESTDEYEAICEKSNDVSGHTERKKVQWTDTSGGELFEVREFEPSDEGESDDEFDSRSPRTCLCKIM